jgi:hypothetical protein
MVNILNFGKGHPVNSNDGRVISAEKDKYGHLLVHVEIYKSTAEVAIDFDSDEVDGLKTLLNKEET